MDPLATINTRRTPQNQSADPRQVPNNAGGFVYDVGVDARVHRFLTIGVEGGTYYSTESDLTRDTAPVILDAARTRGTWLVGRVVEVSTAGRAPKQNPALFALAAVAGLGDDDGRRAAFAALPKVARTGTHLFQFVTYVEQFRGWGRGLRAAVSRWYTDRPVDDVAYQAVKYRSRGGWSHRDVLRSAHPETSEAAREALFGWITSGEAGAEVPALVSAFEQAQVATTVDQWVPLIENHPLSWEMLPDAALREPKVWRALIGRGMPQTALMRQLPRLTRLGVLTGEVRDAVCAQLVDPDRLRKGRVHPVSVLLAQRTYASGRSVRGESSWTPDRRVVDALDAAFYGAVESSGKRILLALDVSGSMQSPAGGTPMTCREVSAALALATMATEPNCDVVGFTGGGSTGGWGIRSHAAVSELSISPRQRLDDAVKTVSGLPFGPTDCALPMLWAQQQGRVYDTFVVLTDSETWHGDVHPVQALGHYRRQVNPAARLVVAGLTGTQFTIADPNDPGSLDVSGFDSAVPQLISDFSAGRI